MSAASVLQMRCGFCGERCERARDEPCSSVRVSTGAAASDLFRPTRELRPIGTTAVRELLEATRERGETMDARAALSGALSGEVTRHARGLGERTGGLGQRDDDARAEVPTRPSTASSARVSSAPK